jgi:hypothetical protein
MIVLEINERVKVSNKYQWIVVVRLKQLLDFLAWINNLAHYKYCNESR